VQIGHYKGRLGTNFGPLLCLPHQPDAYYQRGIIDGSFPQNIIYIHISHPFLFATPTRPDQHYVHWPPLRPVYNLPSGEPNFTILCTDGTTLHTNMDTCMEQIPYFKIMFRGVHFSEYSSKIVDYRNVPGYTSANLHYILRPLQLVGTTPQLIEVMDYFMLPIQEIKQTAFDLCRLICLNKNRLLELYSLLDICRKLYPTDIYQPLVKHAVCEFNIYLKNNQLLETCMTTFPTVFLDMFTMQCMALERQNRLTHSVFHVMRF
jgi:hypothetical protein